MSSAGVTMPGPGAYNRTAQLFDIYQGGDVQIAAIAPHANTNRLVYSIPAGRRQHILGVSMNMVRDGASGAPSYAELRLRDWDSIHWAWLQVIDGAVGARDSFQTICRTPTDAGVFGSDLVFATGDASVGGTIWYRASYHVGLYSLTVP